MYTWKRYFVVQADYQHWANDVLFEALGRLRPEAIERDEGLYFRSIHHTVEHMLTAGQLWLARLQGVNPSTAYHEMRHRLWRELQGAMRQETRKLQDWLERQPDSHYEGEIDFVSSDGKPRRMWVRDALSHLFAHSVHHRGQISAVITRLGGPCPEMDYVYYRRKMEKLIDAASQTDR